MFLIRSTTRNQITGTAITGYFGFLLGGRFAHPPLLYAVRTLLVFTTHHVPLTALANVPAEDGAVVILLSNVKRHEKLDGIVSYVFSWVLWRYHGIIRIPFRYNV